LVNVTLVAVLVLPTATAGKVTLVGEMVTGVMPLPVRPAVWGEPGALSVTVSVPLAAATAVGENATNIVQLAPPATCPVPDGHVPPVRIKGPLTAMLLTVSGVDAPFVRVSVSAALWVPAA
jgi:hypothetical protein